MTAHFLHLLFYSFLLPLRNTWPQNWATNCLLPCWAQHYWCYLSFISSSFLYSYSLSVLAACYFGYSKESVEMWPQLMTPGREEHPIVASVMASLEQRRAKVSLSAGHLEISVLACVFFALPDCCAGQQSIGSSRWLPFQSLTCP